MKNQKIKKIISELQGASKMHLKQSKDLAKMAKKSSPFQLRSPLKQDLTMDSTIGDVGKKIKNTTLRTAAEGFLNSLSSGAYKTGKDLYKKMKKRDGGRDDMMKPLPKTSSSHETQHNKMKKPTKPAGVDPLSKHGEMVTSKLKKKRSVTMTKKSGKLKKKKTDIIRPVNKIKSSSKVDIGPKLDTCWDGYHAEGKKKSPSNKKTSGGKIKMVNNCVKD